MSTQETWTDPEGHDHYDDDCSMGGCEHIEDAPACVKGLRHRWTAEGHGGCEENPGVWSLGGTTYAFESHCVYCGVVARVVAYGWQRNPGQCDTVRYKRGEGDAVAVAAALRAERRRVLARRPAGGGGARGRGAHPLEPRRRGGRHPCARRRHRGAPRLGRAPRRGDRRAAEPYARPARAAGALTRPSSTPRPGRTTAGSTPAGRTE